MCALDNHQRKKYNEINKRRKPGKVRKIMKKFRIVALLAMIVVALVAFCGCNKINAKDVAEDPAAYVMEGTRLTLSESPLAPFVEEQDKVAYELNVKGMGNTFDMGLYLDMAEKKAAVDFATKIGDDENVMETEGALYFGDNKLILESEALKDVFEADAIGIDLGAKYKDFEKSGIYELLESNGVLTEESRDIIKKLMGKDGATKFFSDIGESVANLSKEQYEFGDVKEETITIGDKEVKVIAVTATLNEDAVSDLIDGVVDAVADLAEEAGADISKEDVDEFTSSIMDSVPEMSGEYKYYLSKKTGALVKLEGESETAVYDEYFDETTTTDVTVEVTFGQDPTKLLLPEFEYESKSSGGEKITFKGESKIEDAKLVTEGKIVSKYEDEKHTLKFVCEIGLSDFEINVDDGEEEYVITGEYETTDTETEIKIDMTEAYGKDEEVEIEDIKITVTYGEDVPKAPKYKDILDFSMDDVTAILQNIYGSYIPGFDTDMDYESTFVSELTWYLDMDEEEINEHLKDYEEYDCESEEEFLYRLYVVYTYQDLVTNYGAGEAVIEAFVTDIVNEGGTIYDIAVALCDNYYLFAVPTEDDLREVFDNYGDYGYDTLKDAIDDYVLIYGDYLVIPEEYLED